MAHDKCIVNFHGLISAKFSWLVKDNTSLHCNANYIHIPAIRVGKNAKSRTSYTNTMLMSVMVKKQFPYSNFNWLQAKCSTHCIIYKALYTCLRIPASKLLLNQPEVFKLINLFLLFLFVNIHPFVVPVPHYVNFMASWKS